MSEFQKINLKFFSNFDMLIHSSQLYMTEICKLTLSKLNIVVALISTVIIKMTPAIFIKRCWL